MPGVQPSAITPVAPSPETVTPLAPDLVEFELADGSRLHIPWIVNSALRLEDLREHLQKTRAHYESRDSFGRYKQAEVVKFQKSQIAAAQVALSVLGPKPTEQDEEIAFNALGDVRDLLPYPYATGADRRKHLSSRLGSSLNRFHENTDAIA